LITRQVFNCGFHLSKRAASAAAQQQLVGNRNPEVKHQKVSFKILKINHKINNYICFLAFY